MPLCLQEMCANDHKKPQERKDNVTVGGKMSNLPFFIKWLNKSILYSRGHCSGEEKEKKRKEKREAQLAGSESSNSR